MKEMDDGVKRLLEAGYPYKIRGNDGYEATLVGVQPLIGGDYCGIYRYPRGECVHDLASIKQHFDVIRQYPDD